MIIQAHFDKQDQLDAFLGAWRRLEWAITRVAIAFVLLLALTVMATLNLYADVSRTGQNLAGRVDAPFTDQALGFAADAPHLIVSMAGLGLTGLLWFWFYRTARKLRPTAPPEGLVKDGLSTGKALIDLSRDHLTIKTPLKTLKIAWAAFDEIQETKTSYLFRYKSGDYEFLPKNAIPSRENKEKLFDRLNARVERPLSVTETQSESVSVLYEAVASDYDEFRHWRRSRKEKNRPLLRRLSKSKPIILTGFCLSVLMSAAGFYGALLQPNNALTMMGFIFALAASVIFLTNYHGIMQFAPRFRRDKEWPFNQSCVTTVTLSNNAVFREGRGAKQAFEWRAFEGLIEKKRTVYLVLSAYEAIAAPKRAFMDEQHYRKFVDYAQARLASAQRANKTKRQQRLKKSAVQPVVKKQKLAAPNPRKSHQSGVVRSDGSPAARAHKRPPPRPADRGPQAIGKAGR